jgi:hypothetical protein
MKPQENPDQIERGAALGNVTEKKWPEVRLDGFNRSVPQSRANLACLVSRVDTQGVLLHYVCILNFLSIASLTSWYAETSHMSAGC